MKIAIAIFVKTPEFTPVKTRLANTIGRKRADEFYSLSIQSITQTLKEQSFITPYYAVAEKESLNHPMWSAFQTLHASGNCLGEVMQKTYKTLLNNYDAVILIGSDSPQISIKHLNNTLEKLHDHDYVFGPAADGGFYLLAGKANIPKPVWLETIYSQSDTLITFIDKLKYYGTYTYIETLHDVDEKKDFAHILEERPIIPNKSQEKLFNWIEKHI